MANPQDWPSKSEVFGTFNTLSERLDDLDTHVVAGGSTGALPSALLATDEVLVKRAGSVYDAAMAEVWRQDGVGTFTRGTPSSFAGGIAETATNSIEASGAGAFTFGAAVTNGAFTSGPNAAIRATASGSFAAGYALAGGEITAEPAGFGAPSGGMAFGYAYDTGTIRTSKPGGFALGVAGYTGSGIYADGLSAFALGWAWNWSGGGGTSTITADYDTAIAIGVAGAGGSISALSQAALALGYAYGVGAVIESSGEASLAFGYAQAGEVIRASASNSVQFGPGINATADTVQIGNAGLRLKGTTGAPGTPQNGDIWVANNYIYAHTNGVTGKVQVV